MTRAVSLAIVVHLDGRKMLLVDLDRQNSSLDCGAQRREGSKVCLWSTSTRPFDVRTFASSSSIRATYVPSATTTG